MKQRDRHVHCCKGAQQHSVVPEMTTGRMGNENDEQGIARDGQESECVEKNLRFQQGCLSLIFQSVLSQVRFIITRPGIHKKNIIQ